MQHWKRGSNLQRPVKTTVWAMTCYFHLDYTYSSHHKPRYQCAGHDGEGAALCMRPTIWRHKKKAGNREAPRSVHHTRQTQASLNSACQDWLVGLLQQQFLSEEVWMLEILAPYFHILPFQGRVDVKRRKCEVELSNTHYEMHLLTLLSLKPLRDSWALWERHLFAFFLRVNRIDLPAPVKLTNEHIVISPLIINPRVKMTSCGFMGGLCARLFLS